jgi:hypothetical protein
MTLASIKEEEKEKDFLAGPACCGTTFNFGIVDIDKISNLRFYPAGGNVILAAFLKDSALQLSVSYNAGETFEEPEKVAEITGTVEDMQILAQHNKFVIAIKEWITSTGQHHRRAVSGWIDQKNRTYIQKECTNREIQGGELINISLGFRRYEADPEQIESVDYLFIRDDNNDKIRLVCLGHGGCKVSS